MNLNNFTLKAQEAVQRAQQVAMGNGNTAIETGHLLKGIFETDENVTPFLLKKLNINVSVLQQVLDKIIGGYPKSENNSGQYLSNEANQALVKANTYLKEFKDEFVSIELLLLGILGVKDTVSQMMKDNGINDKDLKKAILELRKGNKVTSSRTGRNL